MDNYHARIEDKLTKTFAPIALDVIDQSHLHAGHAGAREGGQTHFKVIMVSDVFEGKTRVARQRLVHAELKAELEERVHALSLSLRTPTEAEKLAQREG
ncbi:MAG: BolA family protein [Pseudomonadota bacterium]